MLEKGPGWMLENILYPRGPYMSGINCQMKVCIPVVLICLRTEWTSISQGQVTLN